MTDDSSILYGAAALSGILAATPPTVFLMRLLRRRGAGHPHVVDKEKRDIATIARRDVSMSTFSCRGRRTCILAASDNLGLLFFRRVADGVVRERRTVPLAAVSAVRLEVNGTGFPDDAAGDDPAERVARTLDSMEPEALAAIRTVILHVTFQERREPPLAVPMLRDGGPDARRQMPDLLGNALWWRDYLLPRATPTRP